MITYEVIFNSGGKNKEYLKIITAKGAKIYAKIARLGPWCTLRNP